MEKNIPINKGNYSMDTEERQAKFEEYRGWGDTGYGKYRQKWSEWPRKQFVGEYPLNVDLELSTLCNLQCSMCYTIRDEFREKVPKKFMEFSLFKKVIDEIKGKVPAVRLSLRGESTLHPDFIKCIKYAKTAGINEVSTLTNGSKLTEVFFEKMLLAGIDWITISIDGINETYENIRKPLKFSDVLEKVKGIKKIKEKYEINKPVIKIQSIWPAIRENHQEYYNIFEPYVDLIAFNPLIDYDVNVDQFPIEYVENFVCPQIYQRMIISSNGLVMPCCVETTGNFIMGNANEQSVYDIWHGDKYRLFREVFKNQDGFMKFAECKKCLLTHKTYKNEKGCINGRRFFVENYTCQEKQCIGGEKIESE